MGLVDYQGFLVFGINADTFRQGYPPLATRFDKLSTPMANAIRLSTAKLSESIYLHSIVNQRMLCFAENDIALIEGSRIPESGLYTAAGYAHSLASDKGGDPLIIILKYPECRIGAEYILDEISPAGMWIHLRSPDAIIHKIMQITHITFENKGFNEYDNHVRSVQMRDITDSF
ncbi:MAG: hypothetical protein ABIJ34_05000 [archaeon]